jgi:hypothetical protein
MLAFAADQQPGRIRGAAPTATLLDIHGLVIACEAPTPGLVETLERPFRHFASASGTPEVTVRVEVGDPPYGSFPALAAAFSTPRNVVYADGRRKIVDYFGRAVVVHDPERGLYTLHGRDENLLREIYYLLVLALLGRHCDRVGRLRVHALALSCRDRAFLFLMPTGSGKSTLALTMLEEEGVGYISDDDPLFDPARGILPFPRALGTLDRDWLARVPERFVTRVDRMEFGTKFLVDVDYWGDRVERRALSDIVLVDTRRILAGEPRLEPVSRAALFRTLLRDAVLGIGLYQGLEFLVQRSTRELLAHLPVLARRALLAARLARRATTYRLTAGRDREAIRRLVLRLMAGGA